MRLNEPTIAAEEINAAIDVLLSTWVTQGAKVREFERAFWPDGNAVACNSGSSANLLAIAALVSTGRLKPGDEVIVSALSWSTTVWPLVQHGLVPVIVDIDPHTLNIDPNEVAEAIGRNTKAIMPVHVYGNPCDMTALTTLCADNGLCLIADCCEAMGAEYDGKTIGTFGALATFSFYFSHHITTIEGGMVIASDPELDDVLRIQRAHGWMRDVKSPAELAGAHPKIDPKFLFVDTGYNLRMTELQAAIGLCQLPKLGAFVAHRRKTNALYRERLAEIRGLRFQDESPNVRSSCFGFIIIADTTERRVELTDALGRAGVETRPIICGNIALQPGMLRHKHVRVGDLPHATKIMRDGFSIGCHQSVSEASIEHVVNIIKKIACAL